MRNSRLTTRVTGAAFKAGIVRKFDEWIDGGFPVLDNVIYLDNDSPRPPAPAVVSLQHFISLLYHPDSLVRLDMGMSLSDAFKVVGRSDTHEVRLSEMSTGVLCREMLPRIAWFAIGDRDLDLESNAPEARPAGEWLADPEFAEEAADAMMASLLARKGGQRLFDLFLQARGDEGYYRWWPGAFTDHGVRKTVGTAPSVLTPGSISVFSQRYDNQPSREVTAHEWCAKLVLPGGQDDAPSAVACGMMYRCKRSGGYTEADGASLLKASDAVSDVDVLQVSTFLEQHDDADDLLAQGDLLFVWIWERRESSPPGSGLELLATSIALLRKKFTRMGCVVINVVPYQFGDPDGRFEEPAHIQLARLDAVDKIEALLRSLERQTGITVRSITQRHCDNTWRAAVTALGRR